MKSLALLTFALLFVLPLQANELNLVKGVTKTLDEISNPSALQDCPEAQDHKKLVKQCRKVGVKKVVEQGKSLGVKIKPEDVKVCDVDSRMLSLSSYVWFCAETSQGRITQMTQKSLFSECF